MIEVFLLAIALSMDAFSVSICIGAKKQSISLKQLAFFSGLYFGFFQGAMPILGYLLGNTLVEVRLVTAIISFVLLVAIGAKMIHEAMHCHEETHNTNHKELLLLAVLTSLDAMVSGFVLTLFPIPLFVSALVIGVTTFLFSFFGVYFGGKLQHLLGNKAEIFGGFLLIGIGIKVLLDYIL